VTIVTVAFATPQVGWAAGAYGVILKTPDGGASWRLMLTGADVLQLMQTAAAQNLQAQPNDPSATRGVRRAGILAQAGPDKPFLTIFSANPDQATVYGAYRMCVQTNDGGKTWTDCSLRVLDPVSHNLYSVLRGQNDVYLVGEAGDVFAYNASNDQYQPLTSPGPVTLFGILQTKSGALLTFGVAGNLFRSLDQGKTWTQIAVPTDADLSAGVILSDGSIVVVSDSGNIIRSTDDGQTFSAIPGAFGMGLYDVTTAANGNLVFVGSGGVRVIQPTDLAIGG
jgi:photosystem II stability/assembly factor-like uncharacterized protein